jgi:hypothetical protein
MKSFVKFGVVVCFAAAVVLSAGCNKKEEAPAPEAVAPAAEQTATPAAAEAAPAAPAEQAAH